MSNPAEPPTTPGPTGRFPDGRLNAQDEGELKVSIVLDEEQRILILSFGKSITWIGMPPESAIKLAMLLVLNARQLGVNMEHVLDKMPLDPEP